MSTTDIFVRDYPMCDEDDFENCKNMCFCRDGCTDSAAEFCLKWCYLEGGDMCIVCIDDQAVLAESEGELERMIEDISETGKQYGTRAIITAGKEFVRNILTKGGQQKCILLRMAIMGKGLPEAVARRVKVVGSQRVCKYLL
ncbi:hypothetical protein M8J77_006023 [Diaphorina citri]|nr:hypothetical protein M8J77_006023 [Diaphorina citri]